LCISCGIQKEPKPPGAKMETIHLSFEVTSKANFIFYRSQPPKFLYTGSKGVGSVSRQLLNYYTLLRKFLLIFLHCHLKGEQQDTVTSHQNRKNYNTKAV